jgi:YbbR domain-containing protein
VQIPVSSPFKTVPLQLNLTGEPPDGFSVARLENNIDQVTLYGEQALLDKIDFYMGPTINLGTAVRDQRLTLNIPVQEGLIKVDPAKVNVSVEVVRSEVRKYENIPVKVNGINGDFRARLVSPVDGFVDVQVEGAPNLLEETEAEDILAFVDASNLPPGLHEIKVDFNLPTYLKKTGDDLVVSVELVRKDDGNNGEQTTNP